MQRENRTASVSSKPDRDELGHPGLTDLLLALEDEQSPLKCRLPCFGRLAVLEKDAVRRREGLCR